MKATLLNHTGLILENNEENIPSLICKHEIGILESWEFPTSPDDSERIYKYCGCEKCEKSEEEIEEINKFSNFLFLHS